MVIWLRILGAILIIAGFMVPSFFESRSPYSELDAIRAELKLLEGKSPTGDEWQALSQKKINLSQEETSKYLWLIFLPAGILSGTFWFAMASVLERIEKINKNLIFFLSDRKKNLDRSSSDH